MKILALSDLHFWENEEIKKIEKLDFDLCILCGDIPPMAIDKIREAVRGKPLFGVPGNHDTWDVLTQHGVQDIHMERKELAEVCFFGFGGSVRYKEGPYPMHTQKDALLHLKKAPGSDILISHDCSYGLFGKKGSHAGLKGIKKYIKRHHVKLNICGHHHDPVKFKLPGCTTVCVYRCSLITYPELEITNIF